MRYETPGTAKEAVALLAKEKGLARVLAGGTDLLVQMKSGMVEPALIVDIKKIAELKKITRQGKGFRIGAAVSGADMRENKDLRKAWGCLIDGSKLIGSTQIQGRCTVAGNLCNSSPAADSIPGLIAASAVINIAGPKKARKVKAEDFQTSPGKNVLTRGEMVTSIDLPARPARSGSAYFRFTPRTEMDIAVVSAAVNLTLNAKGVCTDARVSLGAVAARVLLVKSAAKALIGTMVDDAALDALAAAASAAATPIDDKRGTREFRTKVAGVLARRAAVKALERAKA